LVTFFIQRLQTFLFLSRFYIFNVRFLFSFERFFHIYVPFYLDARFTRDTYHLVSCRTVSACAIHAATLITTTQCSELATWMPRGLALINQRRNEI